MDGPRWNGRANVGLVNIALAGYIVLEVAVIFYVIIVAVKKL